MKTKLWKFSYNGFHGQAWFSVRVPADAVAGDEIRLSHSQARRLDYCTTNDCQCGEGPVDCDIDNAGNDIYILYLPKFGGEMRGRYPQT